MNSIEEWLEEGAIIHTRYGENIGLFRIKVSKKINKLKFYQYTICSKRTSLTKKLYQQKRKKCLVGPAIGFGGQGVFNDLLIVKDSFV